MQVCVRTRPGEGSPFGESLHTLALLPGALLLSGCVAGSFLSSGLSLNILSSKRLP